MLILIYVIAGLLMAATVALLTARTAFRLFGWARSANLVLLGRRSRHPARDERMLERMQEHRATRTTLLVVQLFIAFTSVLGGLALILGSLSSDLVTAVKPPDEFLEGSPFGSFLIPGVILTVVVGGMHAWAFVELLRRAPWSMFLAAAAGYATLIWIFVQMMFIPFSVLQVVYFAAGALELGLVLLALGVVPLRAHSRSSENVLSRGVGTVR